MNTNPDLLQALNSVTNKTKNGATNRVSNSPSSTIYLPQWLTQAIASVVIACMLLVSLMIPATTQVYAKETITYVHHDLQGNGLVATNEKAQVLWRERFHPFGQPIVEAEPSKTQRAMFHGKPYDRDTGLSYFGARSALC